MSTTSSRKRRPEDSLDKDLLPRSLYAPEEDPREDLRETVNNVLSDKFMAFLSLVIIPIILLPLFIDLPDDVLHFLELCDWLIIGIFIIEYTSKLYLAKDRWRHFKSGWHLLDLVIIVTPFIQFIPFLGISTIGSPSLLLRLLRLPRVLAVGSRAVVGRMRSGDDLKLEEEEAPKTLIRSVEENLTTIHDEISWDQLPSRLSSSSQEWIDINNVSDEGLSRLSEILHIAEPHFMGDIIDEVYPHVDYLEKASLVFLTSGKISYPDNDNQFFSISRTGILVICNGNKIISVSRRQTSLFEAVRASPLPQTIGGGFVVSVLYQMLSYLLSEYRSILSEIELDFSRIGSLPRSKLPKDFLERIYSLNREVTKLVSNLLHFRELLGVITSKKIHLDGFEDTSEEAFEVLQNEATYLNEVAQNLKDNLMSVVNLYINRTSFETNRILKILAVISSIAVIPTTIGGLLGENLVGTPFPIELWEIVGLTAILMSLVAYMFIKLGWLKT
jgi:Mg2+ and Co2+ transporter CorA